jgi:hypothetical protein
VAPALAAADAPVAVKRRAMNTSSSLKYSLYKNYIVLEIGSVSILRLLGYEEFLSVGALHTASLIV